MPSRPRHRSSQEIVFVKKVVGVLALSVALGACAKAKDTKPKIETVAVTRRDIVVDAQATGTVEPINVVEVKSKAGGQIVKMPVETGTQVKPGDLLVQVDTRDVTNQYNQALADSKASEENVRVAESQRRRSDTLFAQRIITAQEHETTALAYANAQSQLVRSKSNLDLAKQRLEEAEVRAPVTGTIIEKDVSLGQVITSATGAFGGGTTLLKMADLSQVRVRALVNETDIGQITPGLQARVTVDAFPDRPFIGQVEKIEPQAVVNQSVTMFPVLVSVSNTERLLMPGMNGEVSVLVDRRVNVLAIPNDAVRSTREAIAVASALGLDPAVVSKQVADQMGSQRGVGGMGGRPGGAPPGGAVIISHGEVVDAGTTQQSGQQAGQGSGQRAPLPEVTPEQCAKVTAVFEKKPAARATLDSIRSLMRGGGADMQAVMAQSDAVYKSLGVDPLVARACQRAARGAQGGNGTTSNGGSVQGGQEAMNMSRGRAGLVFVQDSGKFVPRTVRLGVSNFDYTEVLSGLKEGEQVALIASAALQAQRQAVQDRMRNGMGGGLPGAPATGGRPGGGGAGGGRPR